MFTLTVSTILFYLYAFEISDSKVFATRQSSSALNPIFEEKYFMEFPEVLVEAPSIVSSAWATHLNSYILKWQIENDEKMINSYHLRYRKRGGSHWTYKVLPSKSKSYTFKKLSAETKYTVELTAVVSTTTYSRTSISSFQTGKVAKKRPRSKKVINRGLKIVAVPPSPEATSTKLSHSSVAITWYPKSNGRSPVLRYKLLKYLTGKNGSNWMVVDDSISSSETSYKVHDLIPGEKYRFQLIAVNEFGESIPGEVNTQVPLEPTHNIFVIPPDILAVKYLDNSSVLISWDYDDKRVKMISKFQVLCEDLSHKRKKTLLDVTDVALRQFKIKKLKLGRKYDIRIRAYSKEGSVSPYSNAFQCNQTCKSLLNESYFMRINDNYSDEDIIYNLDYIIPNNYDMAYFISGISFGIVVLFLAGSGIVYRHKLADQKKKFECQDGNGKNFHHQVCAKVVSHLKKTQQLPQRESLTSNCCNVNDPTNQGHLTYSSSSSGYQDISCIEVQDENNEEEMLNACHCAATGVAQLQWASNHVF